MRITFGGAPLFGALYRIQNDDGSPMQDRREVWNIIASLTAAGRKPVTGILPKALAQPDDHFLAIDEFVYVADEADGRSVVEQVKAIRQAGSIERPGLLAKLHAYVKDNAVPTPLEEIRDRFIAFWQV